MLHNFERCLERNADFESNNLKVLYYDLETGYHGTYKSYEYNRICTILNGTKQVTINQGEAFLYTPNDFILLPPYSSVEMLIPEHTKAIVYEINDQLIDDTKAHIQSRFDKDITLESKNDIKQHELATISSQIKRINQSLVSDDPDKYYLIDLISQELVYHLIKNNFIQDFNQHSTDNPVDYAIHYMNQHIEQSISLSELAHRVNLSASGLTGKFKSATGFTPKAYMNLIKLKRSKELLLQKNVSEVSYALGYENPSYFIDLFKKQFGETPKKYAMRMAR